MQTRFTPAQLADPNVRESDAILRRCVHCGFCTATCPTYVLLGDELDSPRGRIYLIKEMLEHDRPASARVTRHIDRCLSCLACMTTCPSGVNYMHLVDHARAHIERTYRRPAPERMLRALLARVLPRPALFRAALTAASLIRPLARRLPGRLGAMAALAPRRVPAPSAVDRPQVFPAKGERRMRAALLTGCAQQVLAPAINEATVRLLTRHGCEVVVAKGTGCCGALTHHMGKSAEAHASATANIAAWTREMGGEGLDAVIANASGCGTMLKDYGFIFRDDLKWAGAAAGVASIARDVTEVLAALDLRCGPETKGLRVAYHSACSMQHGQQLNEPPRMLLRAAGFDVLEIPEGHLCCGSAGSYNLLQPALATRLRDRKVAHIERVEPDLVATGNIGCIVQIASGTSVPVMHTVELLDWATGGPTPAAVARLEQ